MKSINPFNLFERTKALYEAECIDWLDSSTKRFIEFRNWIVEPDRVKPALEKAMVRWIPKQIVPGGAFFFPIYDHHNFLSLAQLRYLDPDPHKCLVHGSLPDHLSPWWFGNDQETLIRIAELRKVLIVEGPSDVLACRIALGNSYPVLSPLGKELKEIHQKDLLLLGVKKVQLLLDFDKAGQTSANIQKESLPFRVQRMICPSHDPSDCLIVESAMKKLSKLLSVL